MKVNSSNWIIKQWIFFALVILVSACGDTIKEVPMERFVGVWELKGRKMFDGVQVQIENNNGKLSGKIIKLNENKLVNFFAGNGDTWVSGIKRSSNYQFKLTENKLAKELFSIYGLSTSQEFKIEFIDDNTIGLGTDNSDPKNSAIIYKRVE